jgi:hypothetical protein
MRALWCLLCRGLRSLVNHQVLGRRRCSCTAEDILALLASLSRGDKGCENWKRRRLTVTKPLYAGPVWLIPAYPSFVISKNPLNAGPWAILIVVGLILKRHSCGCAVATPIRVTRRKVKRSFILQCALVTRCWSL